MARAIGLADPELERFRRELIDEVAAEHGFDPAAARSADASLHEAGGQGGRSPERRASLLIGELARLFRGVLWQTAALEAPCPDPADRLAAQALAARLEPEDVFVIADRCMQADYHLAAQPLHSRGLGVALSRPCESDQSPSAGVSWRVNEAWLGHQPGSCPLVRRSCCPAIPGGDGVEWGWAIRPETNPTRNQQGGLS